MFRRVTRKHVAVGLGAAALAVLGAVAAFAFFTASGTGSGAATVGSANGVTITGVTATDALGPGGTAPVTFTVQNLSPKAKVKVGVVQPDSAFGTGAPTTGNGIDGFTQATLVYSTGGDLPTEFLANCTSGDFTFTPVTVTTELAPSGSAGDHFVGTGTLSMTDAATNQDACQGQVPVVHLRVNNSDILH